MRGERRPDVDIRRYITADTKWAGWLANFPFLPPATDWQIDYFLNRSGPFFARMPHVTLLSFVERSEIRTLFALYAGRLREYQQRTNSRGKMDLALTVGGIVFSAAEPIFFSATVYAIIRNHFADGGWKARKASLLSLAKYIEELLVT